MAWKTVIIVNLQQYIIKTMPAPEVSWLSRTPTTEFTAPAKPMIKMCDKYLALSQILNT
jgi:hypothetical protein